MDTTRVASTSERLKEVMAEQRIKQVDILRLAEPLCSTYDVKFTKSALSQYISGKHEPEQDKLFILAYILNVSEPWLMGFDVPKERSTDRLDSNAVFNLNRVYDWIDYEATPEDLLNVIARATNKLRK